MVELNEISRNVQMGKAMETSELISRALEEHCSVENILKEGLMAGMAAAEKQYGRQTPVRPEALAAARAINRGAKVLRTALEISSPPAWGTVVIGTVKDDLYDIEKNFISVMMQSRGMKVIDLGVSVSPERFIETAKTSGVQIIACSASLIRTMPQLKAIIQTAEAVGIRSRIKIMIFGKPVTEQYRATIGADFYAPDPISAAEIVSAHSRCTLRPAA